MAIRRNPFEQMERLMNEMRDSMFDDASFGAWDDGHDSHVSLESGDDGYVVVADLPGFETEEIDLRFDDGVLTIDAEHGTEDDVEYGTGRARRARSRRVYEQVRLPETVLVDEITASYTNGVLEVILPTEDSPEDEETTIDID